MADQNLLAQVQVAPDGTPQGDVTSREELFATVGCKSRQEVLQRLNPSCFFQQYCYNSYSLTGDPDDDRRARERARIREIQPRTENANDHPPFQEIGIGIDVYNVGNINMATQTYFGRFRMVMKWYAPELAGKIKWRERNAEDQNRTKIPLTPEDFRLLYSSALQNESRASRSSGSQAALNSSQKYTEASKNWQREWTAFEKALRVPQFAINSVKEHRESQRYAYIAELEDHPLVVTLQIVFEGEFVMIDSKSRSFPFDTQSLDLKVRLWDNRENGRRYFSQIAWPDNTHFISPLKMNISIPEFILCFPVVRRYRELKMPGETTVTGMTNSGAGVYVMSLVAKRKSIFYLFRIYLDLLLIMWVSLSAFCLPIDEFASRIAIIQTTMLTVVAFKFVAAPDLPRGAFLTLLDVFILACLGILLSFALAFSANNFLNVRRGTTGDIWFLDEGLLEVARDIDRYLGAFFLCLMSVLTVAAVLSTVAYDFYNGAVLDDQLENKGWEAEYTKKTMEDYNASFHDTRKRGRIMNLVHRVIEN